MESKKSGLKPEREALRAEAIAAYKKEPASAVATRLGVPRNTILRWWHQAKFTPLERRLYSELLNLRNRFYSRLVQDGVAPEYASDAVTTADQVLRDARNRKPAHA